MITSIHASICRLIISTILLMISFFILIGCGPKELSQSYTTKLLSQHYQFPMVEYTEFSLIQGGIYHNPIRQKFSQYRDAGLISFTEKKGSFGAVKYTAQLTPEGYKFVLQDNGDNVVIKTSELEFGEIKGIISDKVQKKGYVEYTTRRVNITPWGKVQGLREEILDRDDDFILYDDGWRLMSNYQKPTFNSPTTEDIENRTVSSNVASPVDDQEPQAVSSTSKDDSGSEVSSPPAKSTNQKNSSISTTLSFGYLTNLPENLNEEFGGAGCSFSDKKDGVGIMYTNIMGDALMKINGKFVRLTQIEKGVREKYTGDGYDIIVETKEVESGPEYVEIEGTLSIKIINGETKIIKIYGSCGA